MATVLRFEATIGSTLSDTVVATPSGKTVATLRRNAFPKQPWALDCEGRQYLIEHVVASNNLLMNDFRYALTDGDATLAWCVAKPVVRTTEVTIGDRTLRLVRRSKLLSIRYDLEDEHGHRLGSIAEPGLFSLWRRRFLIELPGDIGVPQAMFLFFLVTTFSLH